MASCTVAAVANAAGDGGSEPCGPGHLTLEHGGQCTVECNTGYTASVATATCNNGMLDTFTCDPSPCAVGTVENAVTPTAPCTGGLSSIASGDTCTLECSDGFRPIPAEVTTCELGVLPDRECRQISPCTVTAITNAAGTSGAEPCGTDITEIQNGEVCTVACATGYHPSAPTALCTTGNLEAVTCEADVPCTVTAIANAAGTSGAEPCGTGVTSISDGDVCAVQCAAGFHPSVPSATCTHGNLDTVTCEADVPCAVGTVTNGWTGGTEPCGTGVTSISDGANCDVTCAAGFNPFPVTAACTHGDLADRECRPEAACTVVALANGAGTDGTEPCGTGVTELADGDVCTVQCADGFHPSAASASCRSGILDPAVTCDIDEPCAVGTVVNGLATAVGLGDEPCGAGITSIASGGVCTVACADGYRAVPETATCTNGVLAARECRLVAPCTVAPITNAAGVSGAEPCGTGITSILNGELCTVQCATGYSPSVATATCNSGTLDAISCLPETVVTTTAAPSSDNTALLVGLALLGLLAAAVISVLVCLNQKPTKKPQSKRAVKPKASKQEPPQAPPAPPPAPPPVPTQPQPVPVMLPMTSMIQQQVPVQTFAAAPPVAQARPVVQAPLAQAVQVMPTTLQQAPLAQAVQMPTTLQQSPSSTVISQPRLLSASR